jgi:teichoic acid transport system permease protein
LSTDAPTYTEHVYERHGAHGLPPLRKYLQRVWQGRTYLYFRTRAELKARHFDSWFGQIWVILNPLLMASIYWLLFTIVRQSSGGFDFLAFLVGGLFAFQYTSNAGRTGVTSVTGGGSLIANTTMPRALLPMSSVLAALFLYAPTLVVYAVIHAVAGFPVGPQLLALPLIVAIQTIFNLGLAMALATLSVYFRDTSSFVPHLFRIWMYLSPVLFRFHEVKGSPLGPLDFILRLNPLYAILEAWHQVLSDGRWPSPSLLIAASAWATGALVVGGWLFLSREREFAVRI